MDYQYVKGGKKGLVYYSNVGFNEWALLADHVMYGGDHVTNDDAKTLIHTKIAIIDSGNNSIQLPANEFKRIQGKMMQEEPSL